ncbi:hypothetical protein XocBAI15_09165 [Xanthomonas oryzae pv. oryzicola]|nr:hypothetical protein XocBAI15_09165 [Xanthomonas oryzae pv. oryzicola]
MQQKFASAKFAIKCDLGLLGYYAACNGRRIRATMRKRIQNLRAAGVDIEGRAGDGYHLAMPAYLLDAPLPQAGKGSARR